MTPHPQKKYIITGELIEYIENKATNSYGDCMIPEEKRIELRSRPHQAPDLRAAFIEEDNAFKDSIIEQQKIHIETLNAKMSDMMQGASRKAREDVLNEVREKLSHIRYQEEDMWFIEATIKAIESLRGTQQQEGDQHESTIAKEE